ncbi:hypothetical protein N657DRAFT_156238 [Parathielavia appendiculata]|uniref:Uncharacterized protein n=1 Tax=Parathielavia appendiculata TaxID=2587402 RepID=A0AAN6TTL5_9PEZI|nr:hypothetical protein N657DRAFT_156238 [Parathielavia appendiculata]
MMTKDRVLDSDLALLVICAARANHAHQASPSSSRPRTLVQLARPNHGPGWDRALAYLAPLFGRVGPCGGAFVPILWYNGACWQL